VTAPCASSRHGSSCSPRTNCSPSPHDNDRRTRRIHRHQARRCAARVRLPRCRRTWRAACPASPVRSASSSSRAGSPIPPTSC
jgi:hypothetical protein